MKTEAIVASAGIGRRLRSHVRKQYRTLLGKPILIYTLEALSRSARINGIIVVVNRSDKALSLALVKRYNIKKIKAVVEGGRERFDSVNSGLSRVDPDTDIVLIQDGVRPFLNNDMITRSIKCAARSGACVVGVPVKATIKKVTSHQSPVTGKRNITVKKTIDRTELWEIQTPQVFKKDLILRAYGRRGRSGVTDDSMLVERLGVKPRIIMGSYSNIKITTPEDLIIAEAIMRSKNV